MPRTHRYTFGPKPAHPRLMRLLASCAKLMKEAAAAIRQGSAHPDQWNKIANRLDLKVGRIRRLGKSPGVEGDKG